MINLRLFTNPADWLYPITFLSFTGLSISFLTPIFTTNVRWAFLLVFIVLLFLQYRFSGFFDHLFAKILALNIAWGLMSVMWSEVPLLSIMKAGAYLLVTVCFYYAGQLWVTKHRAEESFDYITFLALFALLAAILGYGQAGSLIDTGKGELYQGLAGNSNMLGSLLAMTSPFIIWRLYISWNIIGARLIWITILGTQFGFLLLTNSRAAIIASLCSAVSLIYAFGYRKWVPIFTTLIAIMVITVLISPVIYQTTMQKYVYKYATEDQGLLYTRATVWEQSFNLAKKGGWLGGGYGVTIGDDAFTGGLTAVGYGREKGNSHLAILEELGIIGLLLYLMLMWALFGYLIRTFNLCKHKQLKVLLGICIGTLLGFTFQSVFEAWWVAPGSAEYVYFWAMVGASMGVTKQIYRHLYYLKTKNAKLAKSSQ